MKEVRLTPKLVMVVITVLVFLAVTAFAGSRIHSYNQVKKSLQIARVLSAARSYDEAIEVLQSIRMKWAPSTLKQEVDSEFKKTQELISQINLQTEKEVIVPASSSSLNTSGQGIGDPPRSIQSKSLQANGTVDLDGTTTQFTLSFPVSGGVVSGTASGYCNGSITGTFNAQTTVIQGNMTGTCTSLSIPSSGSFIGNVYLSEGRADGSFEGKGVAYYRSGSWSASFTPVKE